MFIVVLQGCCDCAQSRKLVHQPFVICLSTHATTALTFRIRVRYGVCTDLSIARRLFISRLTAAGHCLASSH